MKPFTCALGHGSLLLVALSLPVGCESKTDLGKGDAGGPTGLAGTMSSSTGLGGASTGAAGAAGTTGAAGAIGGRVPINHRSSDIQCAHAAPAGTCSCNGNCPISAYPSQWACSSDSGCGDAGVNGRCISNLGPAGCSCTSDSCASDSDCLTSHTCACHGSPYTYGAGNACVSGSCRIDADCAFGGYCSPTPAVPCDLQGVDYCEGLAYYCHTPNDQCIDDSDCVQTGACLYSPSDGLWKCHIYARLL